MVYELGNACQTRLNKIKTKQNKCLTLLYFFGNTEIATPPTVHNLYKNYVLYKTNSCAKKPNLFFSLYQSLKSIVTVCTRYIVQTKELPEQILWTHKIQKFKFKIQIPAP